MNRRILGLLFVAPIFATLLISDATSRRIETRERRREIEVKEKERKDEEKGIENRENENDEKERINNKIKEVGGTEKRKEGENTRREEDRKTAEGNWNGRIAKRKGNIKQIWMLLKKKRKASIEKNDILVTICELVTDYFLKIRPKIGEGVYLLY